MKYINSLSKNLITILILVFIYSICYTFFDVFFEDGDDVIMQQIIQGYFTNKPDVHLVFINVIIGYVLKPFYIFNNQIYWYSILLVGLQAISLYIILKFILENKLSKLALIFYLIFFSYFILKVQFTSIAGLLIIAGFLELQKKLFNFKQNLILPLLLFYIGFLIRIEMFLLILFIVTIIFIINHKNEILSLKLTKIYVFQFLIFLILIVSSYYINKIHYENKAWQSYTKYNDIRKKINDNRLVKNYIDTQISDSTQKSDLEMIYGFLPIKKYDYIELKNVKDKIYSSSTLNSHYLSSIKYHITSKSIWIYLLFLCIIFIYYIQSKKLKYLIFLIIFSFIFLYIAKDAVFKNRVFMPIIFAFFLFNPSILKQQSNKIFLIPLSLVILYLNFNNFNYFNQLKTIEIPKNQMIIAIDYPNFINKPFELNIINNQKNIISLGWLSNCPLIKSKISQFGLNLSKDHFSPIDDKTLINNFYYYIENKNTKKNIIKNLNYKNLKLVKEQKYNNLYKIEKNDTLQQTISHR
jgi:hypothetical protein